jgi:pimeloyl-ACP methyl ester carboxylesterase
MTTETAGRIAVDDVGTGEPAVLFIPGWCGDRTVFDDLVAGLGQHRRAISLDLRDHGTSARTSTDFGTGSVVADALEVIRGAGLERVVPVALSHAGWVAIELRRQLGPEAVPGIVLLDWMVLGPPPGFTDALAGLQDEAAWEQVRGALFGMWTTDVETPALHEYVAGMGSYGFDHWRRAGREIATSFAAEGRPLDALAALETPCPTLHLYAQPAEDAYLAAQREYAQAAPWFQPVRLDAQSHFPMFEVPGQMVTAIEEFVRVTSWQTAGTRPE